MNKSSARGVGMSHRYLTEVRLRNSKNLGLMSARGSEEAGWNRAEENMAGVGGCQITKGTS